jgi:prevent-host-death family protein
MKFASEADIEAGFSAYVKASEEEPVVITRDGKPVAVLLAVGDEEELERLILAHSPRLHTILDAARQRIRDGAGVRHEGFWKAVESDRPSKIAERQ